MLDVLIRGGRVIDGAGNPWYRADVGIAGGRIAAVGRVDEPAERVIDADGLFVCPGFIDMHTHSDLQLLVNPPHEAKVQQGVTLDVIGQDGLSYAPVTDEVLEQLRGQLAAWNEDPPGFDWSWRTVGEYLDRLDADGIAINAAYLAPHGTIRMIAMGTDDRPPTADELAHMKRLLAEALEQGAIGLSTGLTYTPGMYADDDEIVALLEVVREHGGYYTPHHRNYGKRALEAYADCIEIARRSGVPLHLAHAHLGYEINKGRAPELLAMIDQARDDGIEVTLDTYPVPRRLHVPRRVPAELDARRRQRGDDRAAARPGAAGAAARRDRGRGLRRLPRDPDGLVGDRRRRTFRSRKLRRRQAPVRSTTSATCSSSGTSASRASPTRATRRTCARRWRTGRTPSAATGSSSATGRTRAAGGRSRATSRSTCASSGSSPGSRRCGR